MAPITVQETLDLLGSLVRDLGPSRVLTSEDPSYRLHSEPYAIQTQRNPHVVLVPNSVEALAKIMRVLYNSDLEFAVRGHGFKSTSAKHVIISMRDFKEFAYDSTEKIATVGAGAIWSEVIENMERVDPAYTGKHSIGHVIVLETDKLKSSLLALPPLASLAQSSLAGCRGCPPSTVASVTLRTS